MTENEHQHLNSTSHMCGNEAVLQVSNATKEFAGVSVLNNVSFAVKSGEIFGLIGENGAGKSTLLKIISGVYTPTKGDIFVAGQKVINFTPQQARFLGVTMIPQEFNLVGELSIFENIFLGQEKKTFGFLNKKAMYEFSNHLLASLEVKNLDPATRVNRLSAAQKQMVEIAKALAGDRTKLLIMDEPTTVLNQTEVEILFRTMRELKKNGISIMYVSHKLKEVKSICDRVMTLRDGNFVSLANTCDLSEHQMATGMVGRELTQVFPQKNRKLGKTLLEVDSLSIPGLLCDISFSVKCGEVFGLAGLMGAGRTETAEALVGLRARSGTVKVDGQIIAPHKPGLAMAAGLSYLSEDRQGKGVLVKAGIMENASLASLAKYIRYCLLDKNKRRQSADRYIEEFSIKAADKWAKLEFFSGGNQQKVALAKCLDTNPKIMIFDEPTRGIDIKAKSDIYQFIQKLASDGLACILISSELEEILGLCHRVAVLHDGRISAVLEEDHLSEEEIMLYATDVKNSTCRFKGGLS